MRTHGRAEILVFRAPVQEVSTSLRLKRLRARSLQTETDGTSCPSVSLSAYRNKGCTGRWTAPRGPPAPRRSGEGTPRSIKARLRPAERAADGRSSPTADRSAAAGRKSITNATDPETGPPAFRSVEERKTAAAHYSQRQPFPDPPPQRQPKLAVVPPDQERLGPGHRAGPRRLAPDLRRHPRPLRQGPQVSNRPSQRASPKHRHQGRLSVAEGDNAAHLERQKPATPQPQVEGRRDNRHHPSGLRDHRALQRATCHTPQFPSIL